MCVINITDDDIIYAELILFGKTGVFDEERKIFIKNLKTIDLQAVPGSGKTTALLAKLLILEKYLPFKDGSGILVISHTNAAVDEIKLKIGKYCPKLFNYPNFVGTIQSFVDKFLAIPFYVNCFKSKPYRIDNEIYNEKVEQFYNNTRNYKLKSYLDRQRDGLSFLKDIRLTPELKLISGIDGTPEKFKLKNPEKPTYKALLKFKRNLLKYGYLHYEDAYFLANYYLLNYPRIKYLLQKRFKYVFVDEMQDMDRHQYDLLEEIFYDKGNSASIYQRIGDRNQAIFSDKIRIDEVWIQRNSHFINGSYRLTPYIAHVVENLALTSNKIEGLNKNDDETKIDIKPHIIIYDNKTIKKVIPTFANLIKKFQQEAKIPLNPKDKFMVIAWRKESDNEDKMTLSHYWKNYKIKKIKKQIDYKVLKNYLQFFEIEINSLEPIRQNIINALLKILRIEKVTIDRDKRRSPNKREIFSYLKENYPHEYKKLKFNLYCWSINVVKGRFEEVYRSLKEYMPKFLEIFRSSITNSKEFIEGESDISIQGIGVIEEANIFEFEGLKIEVGTVHSAKGQTHTATLYLETFYQGKYESEYLRNAILGKKLNPNRKYQKQAARMAYVGFSRPTHLLCFAVHKYRFNKYLNEDIAENIWEIIDITNIDY